MTRDQVIMEIEKFENLGIIRKEIENIYNARTLDPSGYRKREIEGKVVVGINNLYIIYEPELSDIPNLPNYSMLASFCIDQIKKLNLRKKEDEYKVYIVFENDYEKFFIKGKF